MATAQIFDAQDLDYSRRETAPADNAQECVLLIEDNEEAMQLVRYALQEYGDGRYRLEWVRDLHSGIDQLSKISIDIVLLDLGLPDGAGASSYSWVHQVAPDTPVLVLTGDVRDGTEFAVIAHGADDYLVKDQVSGELLVQAIQDALALRRQGRLNQMRQLALDTKTLLRELKETASENVEGRTSERGIRFLPDGF